MWQITTKDEDEYQEVLFKGYSVICVDDVLDLSSLLERCCNDERTYEETKEVFDNLPSLIKMARAKGIEVINVPPPLTRMQYDAWWNAIYG